MHMFLQQGYRQISQLLNVQLLIERIEKLIPPVISPLDGVRFMSLTIGQDSLETRRSFKVGKDSYEYFSLSAAAEKLGDVSRLPFSLKILLENLLRFENGKTVTVDDIRALVEWQKEKKSEREIAYRPARVLMQDFTGVPAVADLAAMREAVGKFGGEASSIN